MFEFKFIIYAVKKLSMISIKFVMLLTIGIACKVKEFLSQLKSIEMSSVSIVSLLSKFDITLVSHDKIFSYYSLILLAIFHILHL